MFYVITFRVERPYYNGIDNPEEYFLNFNNVLQHLCSIFAMNGYDSLEIFAEIDHEDLNALGILDSESRTKLLTAAKLLMDYEGMCH